MKIVITGTSRGIGLELTAQALKAEHQVIAVARTPEKSPALQALQKAHPDQLKVIAADVTDSAGQARIQDAAAAWGAIDVLVNNAGVYQKGQSEKDFLESFRVNSIAPFLLTEKLLPLLKKGREPKLVSLTSKMGSIADNSSGGSYAYRASKAALNAIHKSLCLDQPWLASVVVHPGWVQTDMGGSGATVSIPESAAGIWKLVDELKPATSGRFLDYRGEEIPW